MDPQRPDLAAPPAVASTDPTPTTDLSSGPSRTTDHASGSPAVDDLPPAPPGYEVLGVLGRGGMGVVYRARQTALKREVALKVLLAGGHASEVQRQRFLAEAEAVAAIDHQGVVQVHDFGTWGGQPYLALEFCPGGSLANKLGGIPIPPREAALLVERLARAVAAAHAKGVVHRDIKPHNVLLTAAGEPKVADFGLAKLAESGEGLTATGAVMGTPSYMAPEQARGDSKLVGPAADVYALGAVLYEGVTGRPPFRGSTPADTILQVLAQEPVAVRALNPLVPTELETVCLKCLEKDPARRYAATEALADDLRRWLEGRPVLARPVGPVGRVWKWVRRNPVVAGALAAVVISLAAGAGLSYGSYREADRERQKAVNEANAKDRALAEVTRVSGEQAQTLRHLAAEKEATERTFLLGLLRSLDQRREGDLPSPVARAALVDLAAVPDEAVRFRLVDLALTTPGGLARVLAWRKELALALAALDRGSGVRLRERLRKPLGDPRSDPEVRLACAALVASLPPDEDGLDAPAARELVARFTIETDTYAPADLVALERWTRCLSALVGRLPPEENAAVVKALTDRLTNEKNISALAILADVPGQMSGRLSPAEAAAVAKVVADRLTNEKNPSALQSLADALGQMSGRLSPAEAAAVAKVVADRLTNDKNLNSLPHLALALGQMSARLPPAEAAAVAGPTAKALADQLTNEKDLNKVAFLAGPLGQLSRGLPPAEAAAVAGPAAKALADRLTNEKAPTARPHLARALGPLSNWLPSAEVAAVAKVVADRLTDKKNVYALLNLADALGQLSGRLPPAEAAAVAGPAAKVLADQLTDEVDPDRLFILGSALGHLSGLLPPAEAAAVAGPAAKVLADRLTKVKDSYPFGLLADALGQLSRVLPPAEAAAVANVLADRLTNEKNSNSLSRPLGELARRLGDAELVGLLGSHWASASVREPLLTELGRRRAPDLAWAAALGGPAAVAGSGRPFADVWEFVGWAEKHRPDLALKSRPAVPQAP